MCYTVRPSDEMEVATTYYICDMIKEQGLARAIWGKTMHENAERRNITRFMDVI